MLSITSTRKMDGVSVSKFGVVVKNDCLLVKPLTLNGVHQPQFTGFLDITIRNPAKLCFIDQKIGVPG
jgi:hypothetical protein